MDLKNPADLESSLKGGDGDSLALCDLDISLLANYYLHMQAMGQGLHQRSSSVGREPAYCWRME